MVQLTIYKEASSLWNKNRKEIIQTEVETIEKAIQLGQKSGAYYEVFDLKSCRLIDWNEVNVRTEDPWFYVETEMMWKKRSDEESSEEFQISDYHLFQNPYQDFN